MSELVLRVSVLKKKLSAWSDPLPPDRALALQPRVHCLRALFFGVGKNMGSVGGKTQSWYTIIVE